MWLYFWLAGSLTGGTMSQWTVLTLHQKPLESEQTDKPLRAQQFITESHLETADQTGPVIPHPSVCITDDFATLRVYGWRKHRMEWSLHGDALSTTTLLNLGSWKFHARIRGEQQRQSSDECGHVALAFGITRSLVPNGTAGTTLSSITLRWEFCKIPIWCIQIISAYNQAFTYDITTTRKSKKLKTHRNHHYFQTLYMLCSLVSLLKNCFRESSPQGPK